MNHFKKKQRLLHKFEFDNVFKNCKKVVTKEFIILYCKNTLDHPRLGLAISKKMVAKAHNRNRIKRLLRETFRISNIPPFDIVILAKQGVGEVSNKILRANLNKAWDQLIL